MIGAMTLPAILHGLFLAFVVRGANAQGTLGINFELGHETGIVVTKSNSTRPMQFKHITHFFLAKAQYTADY